uniref:Nephrin-like n=1 Tax=Sinocyclocheilus grahami TaxID=75366 RepID=A0A672MEJ0_SINGR
MKDVSVLTLTRISSPIFFCCLSLFVGVCGQQAFKTEPRNVTVRAGATALLKCEVLRASGAVQWVKDGLLLGPQRSLPGYPRYSMTGDQQKGQYHLQILNVSLEDDGPYECQVGRSVSSRAIMSRTVWFNVQIPPSQPYIQLESDEPWVEGDEHTVTCIAPDAKPRAEITMFRDGEELTEPDSFTMSGSQDKLLNTHAEVIIRARSSDNARQLTCRVKNPAAPRALETSMTMRVYFPPQAPVIMGLENEEVKAGSFLRVVCMSYGGNPLATLHWTKNGEVLSTSWEEDVVSRQSSSVLKMTVKQEDNHAVLRCESVNQVSRSPMSLTRTLSVLFEPAKVTLLGSFEAIEGEEINLLCYTSSSNPPVHIRWWLGFRELNSTDVTISEGDNGGMMTMSNLTHKVSREDNGLSLTCEAFNKGTHFSSVRSEELIVYCDLIFFSLSLRLKGVEQAPKKAEFGGMSRTSKLSLTLESHHWKKRITCQAFSNVLSEGVNNFYTLNVLFPPEFSDEQPDQVPVIEDETAELPVKVSANPDEITCEWIFQGEKLVKERDPRYHFDDWTLEIVNVSRQDGGEYIIECSNAEGKNRTKLKLDVQYAPTVHMKSDPVYVNVGDTADLLCVADANPISYSMFSWKWMGEGEVDDLGEESEDEGTGLLTLYEVTRDRAGFYKCTADNGIAPPGSVEGQLIVRFAPELQKGPQWRKVASRGDGSSDANVVCQARGVPRVHFTWAKKGFPLDLGNPRYEEKTEVTATVHTSILTVINVSAALDYAIFTCTAHNSMGVDSLDIQLLSTNHPDPPSDLKLLRVDHNSVTLEWMPGFDGGLTQNFLFIHNSCSSTGRGLPVYVVVILVVGGLLLFLNPLSCFLFAKWKRGRTRRHFYFVSTASGSTRYASRELINASAQRTLLIDSSSEPDSSVYESYGRQESSHYYYPSEAYSPALFTHPEGPEDHDGRHGTNPLTHDYEEVRGWGTSEDLQGYSLLPPAAQYHPRAPVSTYYEGRAYGKADVDVTAGVYDSMVYRRRRDTDLPFELRGELV